LPPHRRTSPRSRHHKALGEAITELRTNAGLTQEELSDRGEISFQRISELERGVSNPTYETLMRVTKGLGVELSELVSLMEKIRDSSGRG
jgi:XRE family transcriptional regulator, regulator of sulfur utilization